VTDIAIENFVFVPVEEITKPVPGLVMCYVDYFWLVDEQGRVAFFNPVGRDGRRRERNRLGSAQCNSSDKAYDAIGRHYSWCVGQTQLPAAFVKADPRDYL
jgi:hypothetical protein